ncbi:hypothetical protein A0O34_21125 [Chryseobacterium glaciei]|uniref:DUF6268 domain-containing protein n=1 Tax=Chryseobacterium glaciei TaxID=1685010 RepID=A0A172Y0R3_9FLAO|nr:DUF6268 family outer membrane beta-barrel protein [Chryseobacterium glaciei]ANF52867.1 hypothetical protein A0O34_21125 [Chryseobacterium glaciei]
MNEKIRYTPKLQWSKIVLLTILVPLYCNAQESEFFSASYSRVAKSELEKGDHLGVDVIDLNLITPTINFGKNTKFNNMFAYKSFNYNHEGATEKGIVYPEKLHDIQYALLIRQKLNDRWNLMIVPQLIIRSNFKSSFGSRDFFPALAMVAMHKSSNHGGLQWGYGASYSKDFTKNTFTPLFAVTYLSSSYRVDMMLPIKAQFVMTPSKSWEYGIDANLETAIYQIGTENDFGARYTRTINVPVGLTAAAKISGMVWVKAKVGMQFLREYDFLDSTYSVMKSHGNTIESSLYASIAISLRLKE